MDTNKDGIKQAIESAKKAFDNEADINDHPYFCRPPKTFPGFKKAGEIIEEINSSCDHKDMKINTELARVTESSISLTFETEAFNPPSIVLKAIDFNFCPKCGTRFFK